MPAISPGITQGAIRGPQRRAAATRPATTSAAQTVDVTAASTQETFGNGGLPRALNYLGLVVGGAGILTIVPALGELGGIMFGLGQIVWFVWLGMVMLRKRPSVA